MLEQAYFQLGQAILGGNKITAVDVGGAGGLQPHWNKLQGNAKFVMYEPREDAYTQLPQIYAQSQFKTDFSFVNTALSGKGGLRKLFITSSASSSSILRPNPRDSRYLGNPGLVTVGEELIRTKTLEASLSEEGVDLIDMIKIDIQGAELEVLQGLDQKRLDNLLLVEIEVGLVDLYEQSASLGDVMNFLRSNGFELYDLRTNRWPRLISSTSDTYHKKIFGVPDNSPTISSPVYETDALFIRSADSVAKLASKEKVKALAYCQCIYNFFSDAYYVVNDAPTSTALTSEEARQINELIKMWHQVNSQEVSGYNNILQATNGMVWAQYTWTPYPSA